MARNKSRFTARAPSTLFAAALGLGTLLTPVAGSAATIDVFGTPGGDGLVAAAVDGNCSLIEAIQSANSATAVDACTAGEPGDDTIVLPAGATFTVDDTTTPVPYNNKIGVSGLPVISTKMTIDGNGSTVRRADEAANFRLFHVNAAGNLTLGFLNLAGGRVSNQGGALSVRGGTATLHDLTVRNNSCADVNCDGGGLFAQDATMRLTRVAVLNNTSNDAGGGIRIVRPVDVVIEHSTIASNSAPAIGGGISINELPEGSHATIRNSSIVNNAKHGLYVFGVTANAVAVEDSLWSGNGRKDCESTVQITSNGKPSIAPTDNRGGLCPPVTVGSNLASKLGPLADNGGPSKTYALLPGADAIDLGSSDCTANPERDQRGVLQNVDGQGSELSTDPAARCDLGAYESTNVYDFGDAPAPYPTVLGPNGARVDAGAALHELAVRNDGSPAEGAVYLGACVDGDEAPVAPTGDAKSDDLATGAKVIGTCANAGDDEDGVLIPVKLTVSLTRPLKIKTPAGQKAVLDGWIDYNADGDWEDAGERIADHLETTGGTQTFPGLLAVPAEAALGPTYARFRISPAGVESPNGFTGNGEVEDYRVRFVAVDTSPDPFSFTKVTGAELDALVVSEYVTVLGLTAPTPISVAGKPSAAYQIQGKRFTKQPGTIKNGDKVRVRVKASTEPGTATRPKLTVGDFTATFIVVTAPAP